MPSDSRYARKRGDERSRFPVVRDGLGSFSGTAKFPVYVDSLRAADAANRPPVIMLHGACNTGVCFLVTPDGRSGWAYDFVGAGYDVHVIDWPGHGRSPMRANFIDLSTKDVRDAVAALLKETGPAVIVAHSAAGPVAWSLAETHPELVVAIIGLSPGPPANLVAELPGHAETVGGVAVEAGSGIPIFAPEDVPFYVDQEFVAEHWFAGSQAPSGAAEAFFAFVAPESPRVINERFNISGQGLTVNDPGLVARRPILIMTGDSDPRHPKALDARTAGLFEADFYWLPDRGIRGNGHMLMADLNSHEIARLATTWLDAALERLTMTSASHQRLEAI